MRGDEGSGEARHGSVPGRGVWRGVTEEQADCEGGVVNVRLCGGAGVCEKEVKVGGENRWACVGVAFFEGAEVGQDIFERFGRGGAWMY